jgi:hypothetical protein
MAESVEAVALELARAIVIATGRNWGTATMGRKEASPSEIIRAFEVALKATRQMRIDEAEIPKQVAGN